VDRAHWQPMARFAARLRTVEQCVPTLCQVVESGNWHAVPAKLAGDADLEEVFIDSTIVRAHQHAAGAAIWSNGSSVASNNFVALLPATTSSPNDSHHSLRSPLLSSGP
jgi:hypothetical protein